MAFATVNQTKSWMVAAHLQKRSLLIAINTLAGMSIFFFGMSNQSSSHLKNDSD